MVEDHAKAQAAEAREDEARQREIDDLVAQQGMNAATQEVNAATQRMADYAYWQTWLVLLGTVMLGVTLCLTNQANRSAQDAAVAAKAAIEAERPWCAVSDVDTMHFMDSAIDGVDVYRTVGVSINWKNFGRSPALHARLMRGFKIVASDDPIPNFDFQFPDEGNGTIVPPGGEIRCTQVGPLPVPQYSALVERASVLYIFTAMEYAMVGGVRKFLTTSCLRMDIHGMTPDEDTVIARYVPIGPQNNAT